jgi:hypothetical protein
MISLTFRLTNPFRKNKLDTLWNRQWQLTDNCVGEIDIYHQSRCLFGIEFDTRADVVSLDIGLFGYCITSQLRKPYTDLDFQL